MNSPSIEKLENAKNIIEEVQELDDTMFSYNPAYMEALKIALQSINMLKEYMKIGTIAKVEEAFEKQKEKPFVVDFCPDHMHFMCPNCGKIHYTKYEKMSCGHIPEFCEKCGQKLQRGDDNEKL